jgi:hypothetical protein
MTLAGARTLELSRASAADTPSVHRLSKDKLVETTTTRAPYISSHRLREKDMSNEQTHTERANIGVVGLAVMGVNLVRNLASREGNTVAVYNLYWLLRVSVQK